jgi:hypothetical protein
LRLPRYEIPVGELNRRSHVALPSIVEELNADGQTLAAYHLVSSCRDGGPCHAQCLLAERAARISPERVLDDRVLDALTTDPVVSASRPD